jgi:hypothetical protein
LVTESDTTGAFGSDEDQIGVTLTVVRHPDLAWFLAFRPAGPNDAQNAGVISSWLGVAWNRQDRVTRVDSRMPGEPLGTCLVTEVQEDAIAAALSRLYHAIPPSVLGAVKSAPGSPQLLSGRIRDMARALAEQATGRREFVASRFG